MSEPANDHLNLQFSQENGKNNENENVHNDCMHESKHQNDQSINVDIEIQKYNEEKKELYNHFIQFIENTEYYEDDFQNLIRIIHIQKLIEDRSKFEEFFQLVINIANYYHRDETLLNKVYKIIQHYKSQIKQTFSNTEIFNIFQNSKIILLYLFENQILIVDDQIYKELIIKIETNGNRYCHFFYPELKEFIGEEKIKDIKEELLYIFDRFDEKRHKGENDSYICTLIRNDMVEDFISHVNRKNIRLTNVVDDSIFETNAFLNENYPTLIEYSAFYGSIQIFQYLILNKVEPTPSLWLYAIHSNNGELIHLLESYDVHPPGDNYENCLIECIKCHQKDIATYVKDNLLPQNYDSNKSEEFIASVLHYHHYDYFPSNFENEDEFYYLCCYNYNKLVDLFMKKKEKLIKEKINQQI